MSYQTETVQIPNFTLESGEVLEEVELVYERCGPPDAPAILVCHALTGNHVTVGSDEQPGWWRGLIQKGGYIDTNQYQVITFNVLGGCNGSTGAATIHPEKGEPYGEDFPILTVRDLVEVQFVALKILGFKRLKAVVGGSLGGMQVLEWGLMYPTFMDLLIPIAVTPTLSDYGIAFNHIAKESIQHGGTKGLSIARMIGMITYRSDLLFNNRFDRRKSVSEGEPYEVVSYLSYQGDKLTDRFDANSYMTLLDAMNTHDIGRGRGGIEEAIKGYEAPMIGIGFTRDLIYPPDALGGFISSIQQHGGNAQFYEVESDFGHDGFLVEFEKWGLIVKSKLAELYTIAHQKQA
ncbi:homoserine O-acetyltransferase MetX [Pseudalkalibacillus berkeleyi]|uniref:Homoserine O-acetyltransferase n=1 Tax=Pseudalkalibacillus berkeleyi TaxID=1069813 RepID=A0ABS9GY90_9BACL|nr:homoserine O-acetyltransferase [Pseudalkalibacillus berkeleyi]MCF6136641.1 homoserine O-acetyltransferase [Pseudalkalibacillus berkeleyi]